MNRNKIFVLCIVFNRSLRGPYHISLEMTLCISHTKLIQKDVANDSIEYKG